jgi:putative nucleotidyltransferase with HDIG domain
MRGVISLIGDWWTRLWATPSSATALAEEKLIAAPQEALQEAPPVESSEANAANEEQSFRETVRLDVSVPLVPIIGGLPRADFADADPRVRERTLSMLAELRQIPALESLVRGFIRAIGRSEVTIAEIVEAIQNDASLCVRLLGMANSTAVASSERIDDLQTAVHMLGVVQVRRVAQAVFTLRDARQMAAGLDWRHLWIHAFATAAIAEELESRLRPVAESRVHLAALLHDVGKIVLSTVAADEYRQILVAAWNGDGRLNDLERQRLGVEHREAGEIFARRHKLPEAAIAAISHHASPQEADTWRFEVALVSLANYLSKAHGLGFSGARLDERDGEFEDLAAWKTVAEEIGHAPDVAMLQENMAEFIAKLRIELKNLRESA